MSENFSTTPAWPLFDLRLHTPRLELRLPTDEDLFELGRVAAEGVHDASFTPFSKNWAVLPSPERERALLIQHWRNRALWDPQSWRLSLVAVHEGQVVGCQELVADNFGVRRVVECEGGWIAASLQGIGLGREARAAALYLAFAGLEAKLALGGVFAGNDASLKMNKALGFEHNGFNIDASNSEPVHVDILGLTAARWVETGRDHVEVQIDELTQCLAFFGAQAEPGNGNGNA